MNELDQKIMKASLLVAASATSPSRENIGKALDAMKQLWVDLSASVVQNRMDAGSLNDILAMTESGDLYMGLVEQMVEVLQEEDMQEELISFAQDILDPLRFVEPNELEFKHLLKKAALLAIDACRGTSAASEYFKAWRKEEPGSGFVAGAWIALLQKHGQYEDAHEFAALAIERITGDLDDDEYFIDAYQELCEEEGNMDAFDVIQEQWMDLAAEMENRTQYYGLVESMIKGNHPYGIQDVYRDLEDDIGDRAEAHHLVEMMVDHLKYHKEYSEEGVLEMMKKYLEGDDSFLNE